MNSGYLCLLSLIFVTSLTLIEPAGADECKSDSDCYERALDGLEDLDDTECCDGKCADDCAMLV